MSIMEACKMNDNLLIENAILAFLHHYPDHKWAAQYSDLLVKLNQLKNAKPTTPEVQTRGRPAKRQRKKETTSSASSKIKDASTS